MNLWVSWVYLCIRLVGELEECLGQVVIVGIVEVFFTGLLYVYVLCIFGVGQFRYVFRLVCMCFYVNYREIREEVEMFIV